MMQLFFSGLLDPVSFLGVLLDDVVHKISGVGHFVVLLSFLFLAVHVDARRIRLN